MWPILPKDCNCTETASNAGAVCNTLYTSNQFFYNGINSICNDLQNGDDLSVAIQKLENFLCSIEVTQVFLTYLEENIEEFPEFVALVNNTVNCQTITDCFIPTTTTTTSSSTTTSTSTTTTSTSTTTTTTTTLAPTTTTTTTAIPQCIGYVLESIVENASWQAVRCSDDVLVGEIFPTVGIVKDIGCVYDTTLIISGMQINKQGACITTTTTSTTSVPDCICYSLNSIPPESPEPTVGFTTFQYRNCLGETVSVAVESNIPKAVCSQENRVYIVSGDPGTITLDKEDCCTTTTTTTTLYSCIEGQLLIINNTGNSIEDVYASGWLISPRLPLSPFNFVSGIQNGTNNAITVVISNFITPGCIHMYVGTTLLNTIPFYFAGNYTFPITSISNEDCVWFIIDTNC